MTGVRFAIPSRFCAACTISSKFTLFPTSIRFSPLGAGHRKIRDTPAKFRAVTKARIENKPAPFLSFAFFRSPSRKKAHSLLQKSASSPGITAEKRSTARCPPAEPPQNMQMRCVSNIPPLFSFLGNHPYGCAKDYI